MSYFLDLVSFNIAIFTVFKGKIILNIIGHCKSKNIKDFVIHATTKIETFSV